MSDSSRHGKETALPPPAPPLPPNRLAQWHRIIAPLGLGLGSRPPSAQAQHHDPGRNLSKLQKLESLSSQSTAHKTGIPIAGVDINDEKTHAVLAGREILRTVRVQDGKITEELNLRSAISSYSSAQQAQSGDVVARRREYLPASTVRWSHKQYNHIIATAAVNGRMALYDVNQNSSRIELSWMHEHTAQVNKLDFDPFLGVHLLSASQDKTVKLWDIRQPRSVKCFRQFGPRAPVRDAKWSPTDGVEFAICTDDGKVQKWDMRHASVPKLSINGHESQCYTLDWHWDGKHVISAGSDRNIKVWDFDNENRRQKPAYVLRAPQTIMNIRWRPPCWTSEHNESGRWQSTQFCTSYKDDPRIHIWDLRRPLLPFREIDKNQRPVSDLLWNSKDFIWTVASDGTFTQTDVNSTNLLNNELSPCALQWAANGHILTFSEDRTFTNSFTSLDPAAEFLSIPYERISGGDEDAISRSLSDDEGNQDVAMDSSLSRRTSRAASTRSGKSQSHTPSSTDGFPSVYALDKTMVEQRDLFSNQQAGSSGRIEGVNVEPEVVRFLAENYARPSSAEDRAKDPARIFQRLQTAFFNNASACEAASMYRMAQSWRILCSVIIPELKDWADKNRLRRVEHAERSTDTLGKSQPRNLDASLSPLVGLSRKAKLAKSDMKSENLMTSLFKNMSDLGQLHVQNLESTSNVATPLAKPLPDSPALPSGQQSHYANIGSAFETIPPLPPSVLSSHKTAAAASKALFDSTASETPPSSPEMPRRHDSSRLNQRQTSLAIRTSPTDEVESISRPQSRPIQVQNMQGTGLSHSQVRTNLVQKDVTNTVAQDGLSQAHVQRVDGQAAENLEYAALANHRDSNDSLPMFSVSTSGSPQARSLGPFSESIENRSGFSGSFKSPDVHQSSFASSEHRSTLSLSESSPEEVRSVAASEKLKKRDSSRQPRNKHDTSDSFHAPSPGLSTAEFDFGIEGSFYDRQPRTLQGSDHSSTMHTEYPQDSYTQTDEISGSQSTGILDSEAASSLPKPMVHAMNPMHISSITNDKLGEVGGPPTKLNPGCVVDTSPEYIPEDFRPIDFSKYEPRLPFAWSSLPLVCHSIAFDMENGIAGAQFAAHLLMHTHPYLFPSNTSSSSNNHAFGNPVPSFDLSFAELLMRPHANRRIIESLLLAHYTYLVRTGLFVPAAELRKFCIEFNYTRVCQVRSSDKPGQSLHDADPGSENAVMISCPHCHGQLPQGNFGCSQCNQPREPCPVCFRLVPESNVTSNLHTKKQQMSESASLLTASAYSSSISSGSLWTSCLSCGHSAHLCCMQEWLSLRDTASNHKAAGLISEGECPVLGCGCDCGPGLTRARRIEQQIRDEEDRAAASRSNASPSSNMPKKDPVKATPSPAADRTRAVLKSRDPREIQSSDERSSTARTSSGRSVSRTGNGTRGGILSASSRKSVRVVVPDEERRRPEDSIP